MDEHASRQEAIRMGQQDEAHSRWLTFAKTYLEFGFKMAQVNFAGSEQDGFGPQVTPRSKLPIWSRAAEIYVYYFLLKLVVTGVLQYNYELAHEEFKLTTLDSSTSWLTRQEKESQLAHAIKLVQMIGNPFYEVGPPVTIMIILFANAYLHFYVEIRIYNYFRGPIVVGVARLFLNPRLERKLMVRDELQPLIDNVVQSAVNSLRVDKCNLTRSLSGQLAGMKRGFSHYVIANSLQRQLSELKLSHEENVERMHAMVASCQLDPPNRRPERTRRLAAVYVTLVLLSKLGGYLMAVYFLILVPYFGWLHDVELHYGWPGLLFTLETLVFSVLGVQLMLFPGILLLINTFDQITLVKALERIVVGMAGDIALARGQTGTEVIIEWLTSGDLDAIETANKQLVRVLIQYRLFKQQLFSIQPVLGFMAFHIICAMVLPCALMRLYAARLSAEIRHAFMIYCLIFIGMINTALVPTCYLHARCLRLYRSMSHLLARLDHVVSHGSRVRLDMHTLSLLRRELHMPEFATQQFATNARFVRLTYSNLMAANFYCGLWLVPMLMRNTSGLTSGTSALLDILP